MNESKHTPGPWAICTDPANPSWISGCTIGAANPADARRVCDVCTLLGEEMATANARLIAASPDLMSALEDCVAEATGMPKSCGHKFTCTCVWDNAKAVIAKARKQI